MAKEIITTFVCGDYELHLMCAKPETFEGFAENACNLFFPEIEKHNSEKLEPVNLIPFGFLQNHTYFNTIYFPRALEWKFIFDDNKNKAKDFENDLAIIVWFIGKSFENNTNPIADFEESEEEENGPTEEFLKIKTWLNKDYLFIPDEKIKWLSKQDLFLEVCEKIFNTEINEEGFEKTREIALKHSVKPKYLKEMLKSLKKSLEVYDNDEILDFVFKENSLMQGLEILNSKGNYTLKMFFDLLNAENINDFLLEQDITQEFYDIISQFKVPKDLGEIIKVCPLLHDFIKDDETKLKEYLVSEQSKTDFVKNLIKAVQKKLDSKRVIYKYLDIVNKNNNVQDFLLELSKVSELDVVEFAINEYKNYFAGNALQTEMEEKSALAIYLNLYFNFDYVTARNVFDVNDENLNKLQNKLTKSSGEMDVDYVINFLTELPEKEQGGFIKKLGGNTQQKLKELFKQYSDFSTRMKLASLLAKMKNTK